MAAYTIRDVAKLVGVAYWRIAYSHQTGKVPEPQRISGRRMYTESDVERIRKHFARKGDNDNNALG